MESFVKLEDHLTPMDENDNFLKELKSEKYRKHMENAYRESRRLSLEAEKEARTIFLD